MDYLEGNPVGETLPADTDTLEHTVALELVKHLKIQNIEKWDREHGDKKTENHSSTTDFMRSAQSWLRGGRKSGLDTGIVCQHFWSNYNSRKSARSDWVS